MEMGSSQNKNNRLHVCLCSVHAYTNENTFVIHFLTFPADFLVNSIYFNFNFNFYLFFFSLNNYNIDNYCQIMLAIPDVTKFSPYNKHLVGLIQTWYPISWLLRWNSGWQGLSLTKCFSEHILLYLKISFSWRTFVTNVLWDLNICWTNCLLQPFG